jgi:hypothetical protein
MFHLTNQELIMVYEFVAVETKDVDGEFSQTILEEGKVIASCRETALLKVGARLGEKLTDEVEVQVRPF